MSSATNLGRVQPIYKGIYDAETTYYKLDNVFYNGNTYVCQAEGIIGTSPSNSNFWQLVAEKGEMGSLASVCVIDFQEVGAEAGWATAILSGEVGAQSIAFSFGIPAGPTGNAAAIASMNAAAYTVASAAEPSVTVSFTSGTEATADFSFYFPPIAGSVKSVDGQVPYEGSNGNVVLNAVKFNYVQSITSSGQNIARNNICAATIPYEVDSNQCGYPIYPNIDGSLIAYSTLGEPSYITIDTIPNSTIDTIITTV